MKTTLVLINRIKAALRSVYDILAAPLVLMSAVSMKISRRYIQSYGSMPVSKFIFSKIGVFPIQAHYYEPLFTFNEQDLQHRWSKRRCLPGIDLNVNGQLTLLAQCNYSSELSEIPDKKTNSTEFYYRNGMFGHGDADYLYNMIRYFKPGKFVEIGSGFSTLMARKAMQQNSVSEAGYHCEHICIEPYEAKWLDGSGARIYRKRVEEMEKQVFNMLGRNDMLFIDSSHIIRPGGDVLMEYLEILPSLQPGVIVHIHDIFTPFYYPREWMVNKRLFWNEQYLVEALLTMNTKYEVISALHYLWTEHTEAFSAKFPKVTRNNALPCSLWIRKL